ncbi:MAG: hypothetical protein QGD88_09310 [Anaerolineae bacterium]|nr:hypothetical protein [Anaerolineae bacterium]MDK1081663.1 hypothetical protein [Anaerolineae bacterium]
MIAIPMAGETGCGAGVDTELYSFSRKQAHISERGEYLLLNWMIEIQLGI